MANLNKLMVTTPKSQVRLAELLPHQRAMVEGPITIGDVLGVVHLPTSRKFSFLTQGKIVIASQ